MEMSPLMENGVTEVLSRTSGYEWVLAQVVNEILS